MVSFCWLKKSVSRLAKPVLPPVWKLKLAVPETSPRTRTLDVTVFAAPLALPPKSSV
jgi:hypothetical protein